MKYSKDDLIRKPAVRLIIWGLSLVLIVIGSKHLAYNGINLDGFIMGATGSILSLLLRNSYEDLLNEKDALVSNDEVKE